MRAILVSKIGGPEQLQMQETPIPKPAKNEVLVRIHAIGINFIDIYFRKGLYPTALFPYIPGKEASGEIAAVGDAVTDFQIGDRVAFCTAIAGTYAEYTTIAADQIVKIPDSMDYETAAATLLQGLTAYYLSHATIQLSEKDTILVHAGAGGVGLLLIQMAKMLGARVLTTVSSEAKAKLAKIAGADHIIIYSQTPFLDAVMTLTNNTGVNVVYDSIGKDTFDHSLACLARRGMLVTYGQASGPIPAFDLKQLSPKSLFITRPTLFDYVATRTELTTMADALFDYILNQGLQIQIGQRYPLKDAALAHRDLEERRTVAKSILLPGD